MKQLGIILLGLGAGLLVNGTIALNVVAALIATTGSGSTSAPWQELALALLTAAAAISLVSSPLMLVAGLLTISTDAVQRRSTRNALTRTITRPTVESPNE